MIIDTAKYTCAAGHEINEDSFLSNPEAGIFIVADGLGGHSDGEKASMAAIEYFGRNCRGSYTDEEITRLLEEANIEVLNKGDGGKTTVAAAFTENGRFIYANVGDSRVYYFRGGRIIAVTKDHSVCQASVDMGMMRPEDIRGNEDRSRLLKVLGAEKVLNIKKRYQPIDVRNGDAFLICSDGFWEYVYETEMETDLLKSDSAGIWLKYMLKRHMLRAENKGDNYTAICGIIRLKEGEEVTTSKASGKRAPAPDADQKKSLLLPLVIAAAVVVIAAVVCLVFFFGKGGGGDSSNSSQSSYSAPETSSAAVAIPPVPVTVSEPVSSDVSSTSETSGLPSESGSGETSSESASSVSGEEPSESGAGEEPSESGSGEEFSESGASEEPSESGAGEEPSGQPTEETSSDLETVSETDSITESQTAD